MRSYTVCKHSLLPDFSGNKQARLLWPIASCLCSTRDPMGWLSGPVFPLCGEGGPSLGLAGCLCLLTTLLTFFCGGESGQARPWARPRARVRTCPSVAEQFLPGQSGQVVACV